MRACASGLSADCLVRSAAPALPGSSGTALTRFLPNPLPPALDQISFIRPHFLYYLHPDVSFYKVRACSPGRDPWLPEARPRPTLVRASGLRRPRLLLNGPW